MKTREAVFVLVLLAQGCSFNDKGITGTEILDKLIKDPQPPEISKFEDDPSITSLKGTWTVISFEDYAENKVEYKTNENSWGLDIVATFDDTVDPHLLICQNTTNGVGGTFEYNGVRQFRAINPATTYVGQPPWADKFYNLLVENSTFLHFKINSTQLRIYYDQGNKSVTLKN